MNHRPPSFVASVAVLAAFAMLSPASAQHDSVSAFRTSDGCSSCHAALQSTKGETVTIIGDWSASIMANAARDPYWQGSVRREVLDHPEASAAIQDECATCHMPLQHLQDKAQGHQTAVFKRFPLSAGNADDAAAADGVSCAVCHQIQSTGLGTPATVNGNFAVAPSGTNPRPVFGPFAPASSSVTQVHNFAAGYTVVQSDHIRDAALCGSCHTLYTTAYGPGGKPLGKLPEQMTYLEWQHSSYNGKQTCQQCHMPAVNGQVAISTVLGQPRDGVRHHTFMGANFFMQSMLAAHSGDLAVVDQPAALISAAKQTAAFLQSQSARVIVEPAQLAAGQLSFAVKVENLTGHKLPTAFPSRRAWLHVTVTAADGHIVFESGKLNPDGSIAGNANDADPTRYSPHYTRITGPDQVEIFEPILGDAQGHVTTGVLNATQYLKDNRILPAGFDKANASPDIAVHGKAANDPDFTAGSCTTHYAVSTSGAAGPFRISAELLYQPIGYRWAHNLSSFQAREPQAFVKDYEQAASHSAVVLAHAERSSANR
jgi:hypothetical protein